MEDTQTRRPGAGVFALVFVGILFGWAGYGLLSMSGDSTAIEVIGFAWMFAMAALYFAPAIIAQRYHHPRATSIALLTFFLGWTAIGWIAALIWAYTFPTAHEVPTAAPSKRCPYCAEDVHQDAIKCKHCGSDLRTA